MSVAKVTENEFVREWLAAHENGLSSYNLAEKIGVSRRQLLARRRNLEKKYGPLPTLGQLKAQLNIPSHDCINIQEEKPYKAVIFSDCHWWPGVDSPATEELIAWIAQNQPEFIICNGDAFDGASISRHPAGGWQEVPTVADELECVIDWMGRIRAACPSARLIWTRGNHDQRFDAYLATKAGQYAGIKGTSLEDHFPEWEMCWSTVLNSTCVIKHRYKGGTHAGYNNAMSAGLSMVCGHTHRLTIRPIRNYLHTFFGMECGTLAPQNSPAFSYTEHNPLDWTAGFLVLEIDGKEVKPTPVYA